MANSVDPDQSDSVCPGLSVQKLRIITVPRGDHKPWKGNHYPATCRYRELNPNSSTVKQVLCHCYLFNSGRLRNIRGETIWLIGCKWNINFFSRVKRKTCLMQNVNNKGVCLFVLRFYGPINNEIMSSRSVNSGTVPGQT